MPVTEDTQLSREAMLFTPYLIGTEADEQSINLYHKAQEKLNITLTEKEIKRLHFMLNHPSVIGMLDAVLALQNSESGIRKKLYIMLAILESNPRYAKYFLPEETKSPILNLIGWGMRAVFNTITGFILLPWI